MSSVNAYFHPPNHQAVVLRARDLRYWRGELVTAKEMGAAVKEGLDTHAIERLQWLSYADLPVFADLAWQLVVVERKNHEIRVITPVYNWGKAPAIVLGRLPSDLALGEAVLFQAFYSARASKDDEDERLTDGESVEN